MRSRTALPAKTRILVIWSGRKDFDLNPVNARVAVHWDALLAFDVLYVPAGLPVKDVMARIVQLGYGQYRVRDWGVI